MRTSWMYLLGVVFILTSAVIFYIRSDFTPGEHNPVPEEAFSDIPTVTPEQDTENDVIENLKSRIRTALDSNTPALLLDIMTEKVKVTRYGTSCCGLLDRKQISPQFALLQNAEGPWKVGESSIEAQLLNKDPETFESKVIAISANGYVVAVQLTSTDLIDEIILGEEKKIEELIAE